MLAQNHEPGRLPDGDSPDGGPHTGALYEGSGGLKAPEHERRGFRPGGGAGREGLLLFREGAQRDHMRGSDGGLYGCDRVLQYPFSPYFTALCKGSHRTFHAQGQALSGDIRDHGVPSQSLRGGNGGHLARPLCRPGESPSGR